METRKQSINILFSQRDKLSSEQVNMIYPKNRYCVEPFMKDAESRWVKTYGNFNDLSFQQQADLEIVYYHAELFTNDELEIWYKRMPREDIFES